MANPIKTYTLRMPEDFRRALDIEVKKTGKTRTDIIMEGLEKYGLKPMTEEDYNAFLEKLASL